MISYTSFTFFLLYFGITFVLYSLLPKQTRWCVLAAGSYAFYFVSARGNVFPVLFSSATVWAAGLFIQQLNDRMHTAVREAEKDEKKRIKGRYRTYKRLVLSAGIAAVAATLILCKYSNFFISTANSAFSLKIPKSRILQPIGISFFVLEGISYMADVYYEKIKAEKNPLKVGLFLSFMLTVVEGPIARYDQLGTQLSECRYNDLEDVSKGFARVLLGLFKKVVIADRAAMIANAVFNNYQNYSGVIIAAGIAVYTLQLYTDFSGIMDVMCGLGRMMGIHLPENFNSPFFAKSINEFWQRWHISLGTWLRDYIFYNVSFSGPMKWISSKTRNVLSPYYATIVPTVTALFFVWIANGFWHGAGWKYIAYGLYYYVLMSLGLFLEPVFAKTCGMLKIDRNSKAFSVFRVIRTVLIVNIGMLIFRAKTLKAAAEMFMMMFSAPDFSVLMPGSKNGFLLSIYDYPVIAAGVIVLIAAGLIKEKGIDMADKIYRLPYAAKVLIYLAALFVIIIFGAYGKEYGVAYLLYADF